MFMLGLSLAYALGRGVSWIDGALFGIKAAVLVIVVEALLRIGRRALKTPLLYGLAGAAFLGIFFLNAPFPLIVAIAALIGCLVARTSRRAGRAEGRGDRHRASGAGPLAAVLRRVDRRADRLVGAGRACGARAWAGQRTRHHRRVLLEACRGELRRRLRAARLHGAAGGRDAPLDDCAREWWMGSGWPRPRPDR
jgi:hypothetical protein